MRFGKVSYKQFVKDIDKDAFIDKDRFIDGRIIEDVYNTIKLPRQGTAGSMGMDFYMPYTVRIKPHSYVTIPTGVRWIVNKPEKNYGLMIVPRSSLGFKHGIRLANTVGIIDSDYQYAKNEGHILIKLYNPSDGLITLHKDLGFAQGIVMRYAICDGAESDDERIGGFGSTGG